MEKCYCIKCNKELNNLAHEYDSKGIQPSGGLDFHTYGHYGSKFFDPMNGDSLHIAVCDECVEAYVKSGKAYEDIN